MAQKVIDSISCDYAKFSGNVERVKPSYVDVPSILDLNIMENKLEREMNILSQQMDELREMQKKVMIENQKLHENIHELLKQFKKDLDKSNTEMLKKIGIADG